jgi:uncharacterized Fe-S cluster protein YjdI
MDNNKTVEYKSKDITIIWEPNKCTHSANCVKALPKVYNPKERPWLKIENAKTQELINQINTCPSKALTYKNNK